MRCPFAKPICGPLMLYEDYLDNRLCSRLLDYGRCCWRMLEAKYQLPVLQDANSSVQASIFRSVMLSASGLPFQLIALSSESVKSMMAASDFSHLWVLVAAWIPSIISGGIWSLPIHSKFPCFQPRILHDFYQSACSPTDLHQFIPYLEELLLLSRKSWLWRTDVTTQTSICRYV